MTVLGMVIAMGGAAAIALGHLLVGGLLVLLSGLCDLLDGALARKVGKTSRFGALLDSTLDRAAEAAYFFGLLILYIRLDSVPGMLLVNLALVGSVLVSYVRARAEGLGLACPVGVFSRAERVVVLALGLILNQVLVALGLLCLLAFVTVGQRLLFVWQQTKKG